MIVNLLVNRLNELLKSPKLEPFKSEHFDEWVSVYQRLDLEQWNRQDSKMLQGNMSAWQDRTRTIPHYLKMSRWEPHPEVDPNFNKTFKDICLETAEAIVKRANGQKINISWSGGLDSTLAFFSLLEVTSADQLKIFGNYNSIVESGSLFDKYIRDKNIDFDIETPLTYPTFGEGLIVTGYLGDQLYGRYHTLNPKYFNAPWKDFINPEQVELVERILPNWPGFELKVVPDFLNFIEMNCKWQMGKTNRMRNMPKEIADRIINFYEPVDFQKWSLGNYEPKWLSDDPKTHKYSHRLVLRDFMKSDAYPMNKVVQTSHYHILDKPWVMLLEDGTNLYMRDFK
jgi:hypothetical protein